MRFRDLDQQAVERLWDRWKHIVWDILEEFNEDVYQSRGVIRENTRYERIYLALETRKACLYIFPIPGGLFVLRLYRGKLPQECLSLKNASSKVEQENLVGGLVLEAGRVEEKCDAQREVSVGGKTHATPLWKISCGYGVLSRRYQRGEPKSQVIFINVH